MASASPSSSPSTASKAGSNAPAEALSSSPRSSGSSGNDNDNDNDNDNGKGDDSFTLSSDAAEQNVLRHPKGKRKRTAAKDKAILEAAYLANPKPDKTARLDIVSQVSLNEKEVQIWFQNRRQNDRRKSRPLSPQEIAALRFGGMHALSSDPPPPYGHSVSQNSSFSDGPVSSSPPQHQPFGSASMGQSISSTTPTSSPELGPWMPNALARKLADEEQHRQQHEQVLGRGHGATEGGTSSTTLTSSASHSFPSSAGSIGYLANRWNMHSSFSTPSSLNGSNATGRRDDSHEDSLKLEPFMPSSSSTRILPPLPQQQPPPQQQSHQRPFRLSLSLEGKAEIISSQSPSPPRLPPPQITVPVSRRSGSGSGSSSSSGSESPLTSLPAIRRPGLTRSQSDLPGIGLTLPPISSLTGSLASNSAPPPLSQPSHPPRLLRGRSRDVHAWESVCDAETRVDDELSAQAQNEASGSAIAAISLLRSASATGSAALSTSASSVLQLNGAKRNIPSRSAAAPRPGVKRAKLGRALSSVARLQSGPSSQEARAGQDKGKVWVDEEKKKKLKLSTLLSGNDSDKENWSPDEDGRPVMNAQRLGNADSNGRRTLPPARNVLQSKNTPNLLATRQTGGKIHGAGASSFDCLDIYEDASSAGSDSPQKRTQLSRAATVPAAADVERFMRGAEVSPSKKGDLDCVAGLLSLSQGNWR